MASYTARSLKNCSVLDKSSSILYSVSSVLNEAKTFLKEFRSESFDRCALTSVADGTEPCAR